MKKQLIVTLVASALELHAASAGAQSAPAQCSIAGTASRANGASTVHVGPLNPTNGFPEYVSAFSNGRTLAVQRCLDPVYCFASPVIATDPFSIQIGSGIEAFYWGATNVVNDAAGNRVLTYVAAAETAFLQFGPNGEPIDGAQFAFLRLRFTMGVPTDGTYTVVHPYGTDTFKVTGATGKRDVFFTIDKGLTPNTDVVGAVGGFLYADPSKSIVPAGFLGDGGLAAAPVPALGSPCNWNYVQVSGVDTAGKPVVFGGGETVLLSDLFSIQGQIYDGRVQTPVSPTRLTYSRGLTGGGQIDGFAASTATATVTVVDGPTIPLASSRIAKPVTLDHANTVDAQGQVSGGIDSTSVVVSDASALPPIVALTAAEPGATPATDPTTFNLHLVDLVDISVADYDPATQQLKVTARSGDQRLAPTLTLRDFGTFAAGNSTLQVSTAAPPAVVHVDSAAGGSASAQVRVVSAAVPNAPATLSLGAVAARSVTLDWTDSSSNESGFKVYSVALDANGVVLSRSLLGTVAANSTSAVVSGLQPTTAYVFQVDAYNGAGAAASPLARATTLALPVAPTIGAVTPSTSVSRGIDVSFTDNSGDETSFQILRATAATGPFTAVGSAAAHAGTGLITFTDTSGPPLPTTSYFYQVTAVRGSDTSAASATSAVLTTPAAPSQIAAPAVTPGSSIGVSWTARAGSSASGYVVYRAPVVNGVVGAFAPVSGATPLPLTTTSYSDSAVVLGSSYQYHVNAVGWTSYTVGTTGLNSTTVQAQPSIALLPPTGLSASNASKPVLNWVNTTGNQASNYRVSRTAMTVNADGTITAGGATPTTLSSTVAASATTYTDTSGTSNNATLAYSVTPIFSSFSGTAATAYTVIGTLTTANSPTLTRALTGTSPNQTAQVTVGWTKPGNATAQAAIGGYEIQRCTGSTCTNFVKVNGTAVNTTGTVDGRDTLSFVDKSVARATTYRYRMRVVGGAGTGGLGNFSGTVNVTTQ
ncbi:MAG: hypothetical protein RIQ60_977 [Pseudomonadota bacterium]|jgi:hypothetical protein